MRRAASLRLRLVLVILPPLALIAVLAGLWQLSNARATVAEVHDRRLLLTALAVAYDVTLSGGDALAPATRDLLSGETGLLFYHVYAPDGVIVAGYATPPVGIGGTAEPGAPVWFDGLYRGAAVRGVRMVSQGEVDGIAGRLTTTVWQDAGARRALIVTLMARSLAVIGALIGSVALVVWFGVRFGLRPLADLEAAIALRSSDDLTPIRRPVPPEVAGVVARLNALFGQVSRVLSAQADFIADAAHQLRNPIAGVLSLAEAVRRAPDIEAARTRSDDLVEAARDTVALAEALLLLERARAAGAVPERVPSDLARLVRDVAERFEPPSGVSLVLDVAPVGEVACDPVLLGEALRNLLDNAACHGGPALTEIRVSLRKDGPEVRIDVADDGRGVPDAALPRLTERFRQIEAGPGSGLGLAIAAAVAEAHGGGLVLANDGGLRVTILLAAEGRGARDPGGPVRRPDPLSAGRRGRAP